MAEGIGNIIGSSVGEAAAFAAGVAIGPLLAPVLRQLENETWSKYQTQPVGAVLVAQGVAEGKIDKTTGYDEAANTGFGASAMDHLVAILKTAPSVAEALNLIRRGQMSPKDFPTVLQRAGIEDQWLAAYQALTATGLQPWEQPLSPADLAVGMVRNNVRSTDTDGNPIFPPGLSSEGSQVAQHPVPDIDPQKEAAESGMTLDRFTVLANNVGLPPGVIQGLQMLNRGIITEADFALLIEQSDMRIAWGPFILQLRRMLLTPHEYAELQLRGYITQEQRDAGAALHGLEPADAQLLYDVLGRAVSVKQITTGLARGGVYRDDIVNSGDPNYVDRLAALPWSQGGYSDVPAEYIAALERGNLRPEYYSLAYANRFTYPSYFVIKPLVADGALSVADATQIFENEGWPSDLAQKAAQSFAPAAAGGTKPKKLTNATIRSLVKKGDLTVAEAITRLEANGLDATDAQLYLDA